MRGVGGDLREFIREHGGRQANFEAYMHLFEQLVEGLDVVHKEG